MREIDHVLDHLIRLAFSNICRYEQCITWYIVFGIRRCNTKVWYWLLCRSPSLVRYWTGFRDTTISGSVKFQLTVTEANPVKRHFCSIQLLYITRTSWGSYHIKSFQDNPSQRSKIYPRKNIYSRCMNKERQAWYCLVEQGCPFKILLSWFLFPVHSNNILMSSLEIMGRDLNLRR